MLVFFLFIQNTHTVIKCYFVTLHVASRGFIFSPTRTLSSIYCALHTLFIQIKLSPKFHTNAYFVVFFSCAFANLMTHSTHTHTHTETYTQAHRDTVTAIKYTTGQRKPIFVLTQSFFVNFQRQFSYFNVFFWFCFFSVRANCFYFVLNDLLRAAPARRSQSTTFSKHVEFVSDTCIKCRCRRRCCHDYFHSLI